MAAPKKLTRCVQCARIHTTKLCPVLTGKRQKQWDDWDKRHARAVWSKGKR